MSGFTYGSPGTDAPDYNGPGTSNVGLLTDIAIKAIQNAKVYPTAVGGNTTAIFVIAVIVFIIISAYLPDNAAAALSVTLLLGALIVNQQATGGKGILQTLGLEQTK